MNFSGFRAKFQKILTCVAFSIKFAKTNQKFAENSEFCEKIHYYCELFTSLLTRAVACAVDAGHQVAVLAELEAVADGHSFHVLSTAFEPFSSFFPDKTSTTTF